MLETMLNRFARDRRATIALITAIFIFPLMFLGVGVPIDLARAIQYRAALQNLADTAALAGSEVLGIGANPAQACALTLAYADLPINNGELPATVTPSAVLTSPNGTASICNGAAGLSTPQTTTATAPNLVGVTISGSQPTTFLSIYKPAIPVTVSSNVIGPQGFITICANPQPNPSGDLSQVYYYLENPDGTLVNEDNSAVNPSSDDTLPGDAGGVLLTAFLGDDDYLNDHKPTVTQGLGYQASGYRDAAHTEIAVQIKPGLAQRLGFAYYVVSNGQTPCIADPNFKADGGAGYWTSFECLQGDANYAYNPYNAATNIGGFFNYYQTYALPAYQNRFLPNAYGSPIGWVNAFYSTDYPASLNSNNYFKSATGKILSPTAGDSCFTTYNADGTVASVSNGFTAASQSCLIQESASTINKELSATFGTTITPGNPGKAQGNVVFWSSWSDPNQLQKIGASTYPAKTDLVCLVHDGGTLNALNAAADTTRTITNKGKYSVASNIDPGDQQENFVIANSALGSTPSGPYGPNVYKCPVDTVGDPYYPAPTCAELNGATLQVAWNDMGGVLYDNGNYVDLRYSYSCHPPAAQDIINSAIIQ